MQLTPVKSLIAEGLIAASAACERPSDGALAQRTQVDEAVLDPFMGQMPGNALLAFRLP